MAKIINDKYYTPIEISKYCIDKTFEIIGKENISEIIEPAAGNGSFSDQIENCKAYDLYPEKDNIIKQDFLDENFLVYKKNRLIIGNPPYGGRNLLFNKFLKKSFEISDYVSFILSISLLNQQCRNKYFKMIYSEDLKLVNFSGYKKLHVCLNIYKRVIENKKNLINKNIIKIVRKDNKEEFNSCDYDFRIIRWGRNSGRFLNEDEHYAGEYKIKIVNKKYFDKILNLFKSNKLVKEYKFISMQVITIDKIYKFIYKYIPELENIKDTEEFF